jgi:hypothetical protein
MKKIGLALLGILLSVSIAWGISDFSQQSATQTGDAAISTSPGYLHGIVVMTDGTNAVTVEIYDNKSAASGTKMIPTWTVTTSNTNRSQSYSIEPPVKYTQGIYVDVTCAGTVSYMVYFSNY